MRKTVKDHLQRDVAFAFPPRRVVSLCPSLTETLFALGLERQIVGRTRYCIHPADRVRVVPTVGGTKDVNTRAVANLRPDLVIAEKDENRRDDVEALAASVPVYVIEVTSYEQALRAVRDLGALTNRADRAAQLVAEISSSFSRLRRGPLRSVAYLVWRNPYIAVGRETYVDSLLQICGLRNVCADLPGRYPTVTVQGLRELAPELVLLSSEPFPFDASHVGELTPHLPHSQVMAVDGEMFGWYGSRMVAGAEYLADFLATIGQP